jgi:transposase
MFVGMDLHKNYLQIAIMNKEGRVLRNSKIDNNLKQISSFFNDVNDKAHVVMESSSSVWYNIYTGIPV